MADCRIKKRNGLRDVLQRKFRKSKTTGNCKKYKRQRNKVNNLIKRSRQNYNKNLLDRNTKNTTSFWRTLKSKFPTKPKSKLTIVRTLYRINQRTYRYEQPKTFLLLGHTVRNL